MMDVHAPFLLSGCHEQVQNHVYSKPTLNVFTSNLVICVCVCLVYTMWCEKVAANKIEYVTSLSWQWIFARTIRSKMFGEPKWRSLAHRPSQALVLNLSSE